MIKKYLLCYGYLLGIIVILTLIMSGINYFVNIPMNVIRIVIPIIGIVISSFILGKNTKEKAYLEGIKFASIFLILVTIFRFIMKIDFNYKTIIMYVIILLTSMAGSTIGINQKKDA